MEEKNIPIEGTTDQTIRTCEPACPCAAKELMDKLKTKADEEAFRAQDASFDRDNPRYRGICTNLGNPVFSNTPVEPPFYRRPQITYGLKGFQIPIQHAMYTTSSSDLGQQPKPGCAPEKFFPKDVSFTRHLGPAYKDTHFTTELDKTPYSG